MIEANRAGFYVLLIITLSFLTFYASHAELCNKWSEGSKLGVVDHNQINEASGIETSRIFPDRLYHINDSGGGQYFYITELDGKKNSTN